jgi:hypothetical protein
MSHSRVFCIVTNIKDKEKVENALAVDAVDVVEAIRGCDYASDRLEEGEAFVQEDVDWLADWIGIDGKVGMEDAPLIKPEERLVNGVIYSYWAVPVDKLKKTIEKEIKRRIVRIKNALKEPSPSLADIAYEAYLRKGFYFYFPGWGFMNEIDLYEFVLNNPNNKYENFYIVKTLDYHY